MNNDKYIVNFLNKFEIEPNNINYFKEYIIKNSNTIKDEKFLIEFTKRLRGLGYQKEAHLLYLDIIFNKKILRPDIYSSFLLNILMHPDIKKRGETFYEFAKIYQNKFKVNFFEKITYSIYKKLKKNKKLHSKEKINIAFTCHFFGVDTSKKLFNPILKFFNNDRFNIFIYSDNFDNRDESDIEKYSFKYVNTSGLNNISYAKLLINDDIDILIENNGHLSINRYSVVDLAHDIISVAFFNTPHTTGLNNMNYIIASKYMSLDKVKSFFSEDIMYLDDTIHAVEYLCEMPIVKDPPMIKNNFITFGSFGSLGKISKELIAVYCQILRRIPTSRIILKYPDNYDNMINAKQIWLNHFINNKIDSKRVSIIGSLDDDYKFYDIYNSVDIVLDSFPYNAGTTTIDALYMGTPVISKQGDDYDSQHSLSTLSAVDCKELLAKSTEEYIEIAVKLANDKDKITYYNKVLRKKIKGSSQCNMNLYAKNIEKVLEEVFRKK